GIPGMNYTVDMQYMENAYELLDEPGEWYLDVPAHVLYYMPRAGEDMATAVVEVPVVEKLLDVTGALGAPAGNLQFEGISFVLANYTHPSYFGHVGWIFNGYFDSDADRVGLDTANQRTPAAAVTLEYAANVRFERCRFAKLGSAAINMTYGSQDNLVRGCTFTDIAGTGIQLGNSSNWYYDDNINPEPRKVVRGNTIDNSYFERCAQDYKGGSSIFNPWTADTTITHNEIFDLPYSGMIIGFGWGFD